MKVRTVYFKTSQLEQAVSWWSAFLGVRPLKTFPQWQEFRAGNINLGFLRAEAVPGSGGIPVFELADDEISEAIARAKRLGATVVLEGEAHPDHPNTAAVLRDPFGNEFELTNYHG